MMVIFAKMLQSVTLPSGVAGDYWRPMGMIGHKVDLGPYYIYRIL
jgi:hypothetical protein